MAEQYQELIAAAREAAARAYAPYSDYQVGAALLFEDGAIVTGSNVENASYGLSLCAETNAVSKAMNDGRRGGLQAVAVVGPRDKGDGLHCPLLIVNGVQLWMRTFGRVHHRHPLSLSHRSKHQCMLDLVAG